MTLPCNMAWKVAFSGDGRKWKTASIGDEMSMEDEIDDDDDGEDDGAVVKPFRSCNRSTEVADTDRDMYPLRDVIDFGLDIDFGLATNDEDDIDTSLPRLLRSIEGLFVLMLVLLVPTFRFLHRLAASAAATTI